MKDSTNINKDIKEDKNNNIPNNKHPKLLNQVQNRIRAKHYSIRTEQTYLDWIKKFIIYHGKRHPADMGDVEICDYLTHLAVERKVASSTQNQALSAILFLYRNVLNQPVALDFQYIGAKRPKRLPVVLTKAEVQNVLVRLSGEPKLIAQLCCGRGLR